MSKHLRTTRAASSLVCVVLLLTGCSLERMATNRLGDVLAAGGTVYASDDDPELIEAATPFSLKLMESVLAGSPEHRALLATTAAGFTQYAYAFVHQEADAATLEDPEAAAAASMRARRLYLRARNYGLRGLDATHPGFSAGLATDPAATVSRATKADVELLYWTGVAWAAAIGFGKDDPALVADLDRVSILVDRARDLDESWGDGALHAFLITWEMVRPDSSGEREERARAHFERAIALSDGLSAGPWVAWAESVCLAHADRACFEESLQAALDIDPDARPATRLENLVMQRRARWLLAGIDRRILPPLTDADGVEGD
jgi:predicted anti-sigma-YlaC factor YlaD